MFFVLCDVTPGGGSGQPATDNVWRERKTTTSFTLEDAQKIADAIGVEFDDADFDLDQFHLGMNVELEHGTRDPETNVTGDDPVLTAKIALAHLNEFPDYYTHLDELEESAKRHWGES